MRSVYRLFSRLGWYGVTVLVGAVVSIATVPFVIRLGGAGNWTAIAVGQSLGSFLNVFTYLGWLMTGPNEVALSDSAGRAQLYWRSVWLRGSAFVLVAGVSAVLVYTLGTENWLAAYLACCCMLSLGLSASWFYVGESEPKRLFFCDTLPRSCGVGVGVVMMGLTHVAAWYAGCWLVGGLASFVVGSVDISRRHQGGSRKAPGFREVWGILRSQANGILTGLLTSGYLALPLVLIQSVGAVEVPGFALADKLKQFALTAVRPVGQVLQGWTPSADRAVLVRRVGIAWLVSLGLGLTGAVGYWLLAGPLGTLFGGREVALGWNLVVPIGISFGAAVVTQCSGVASLVPLGRQRWMTVSSAVGAVVAVGACVPLTVRFDACGGAWVVAVGQLCVLLVQTVVILQEMVGRRDAGSR